MTIVCDRCEQPSPGLDPTTRAEGKLPDLTVKLPWVGGAGFEHRFQDLCDDCRNAVLGYLGQALKVPREELHRSSASWIDEGKTLPQPKRGAKTEPEIEAPAPPPADDAARVTIAREIAERAPGTA